MKPLSEKIMIDQWDKEAITSKIFTSDVAEAVSRLKEVVNSSLVIEEFRLTSPIIESIDEIFGEFK